MRCYFDLVETVVDSEGVEVADLNEARGLALEAVAEMTQARAGEIRTCTRNNYFCVDADDRRSTVRRPSIMFEV